MGHAVADLLSTRERRVEMIDTVYSKIAWKNVTVTVIVHEVSSRIYSSCWTISTTSMSLLKVPVDIQAASNITFTWFRKSSRVLLIDYDISNRSYYIFQYFLILRKLTIIQFWFWVWVIFHSLLSLPPLRLYMSLISSIWKAPILSK